MEITKTRLNSILMGLLGKKILVDMWWNSPNKAFEGKTPNEVNDLEQIFKYLNQFMARQHSWPNARACHARDQRFESATSRHMNTYKIAYLDWYSNNIQFSEEEAESGLQAMKEMDGIYKFDSIIDEEEYFAKVESRGGFVAYETKTN